MVFYRLFASGCSKKCRGGPGDHCTGARPLAEAGSQATTSILEEVIEVALAGGGEPELEGTASSGVIASVLQFSGALAAAE